MDKMLIEIDGRTKVRPNGSYKDISNDDYHADRHYFSSSQIKEALKSPAHFKYLVLDRQGKKKSTGAQELGTLTHTILLEPHKFDSEYVVYSGDVELNKDGTVPSRVSRPLMDKHPGMTVISKEQYDFAMRARRNVEKYQQANDMLFHSSTTYEESHYADCPETGLKLRVRTDALNLEKNVIIDVKTAADVDMYQFKRAVSYSWHYDLSAYQYQYVIYLLTGQVCDYYWLVIGKDEMTPVALYKMSDVTRDDGKKKYFKAIDNIKTALLLSDEYRYQLSPQEI